MSIDGQDTRLHSACRPKNIYLSHQKQMPNHNNQQHQQHQQQQVATTPYVSSTHTSATTNSDYSSTSDDYYRDDDDDNLSHHLSDLMPNHQLYFNEALLAVASAEEYAAKILALQQACLRPLKEDLADWLNKIMSTSVITRDNFMHKLDNGVIICRLAKIISVWCLEKLKQEYSEIESDDNNAQGLSNNITASNDADPKSPRKTTVTNNFTSPSSDNDFRSPRANNHHSDGQTDHHSNYNSPTYSRHLRLTQNSCNSKQQFNDNSSGHQQKQSTGYDSPPTQFQHHLIPNTQSRLSLSSTNVKDLLAQDDDPNSSERVMNYDSQDQNGAIKDLPCAIVSPLRQLPLANRTISTNHAPTTQNNHYSLSSLRSTGSQSINCLNSLSHMMMNASYSRAHNEYYKLVKGYGPRRFLDNLIRMDQTKIWEDARCRTFYARDNVCNFIRWSKEFGVNQSVLFESDDLVLHANPRQVVLCLLDVARIACVKHGFTEAPGLVKFEQQIEAEAAQTAASNNVIGPNNGRRAHLTSPTHQTKVTDNDDQKTKKIAADSHESEIIAGRARLRSTRGNVAGDKRTSIGDATDELILRYCKHKEEQQQKAAVAVAAAAKAETARLEAEAAAMLAAAEATRLSTEQEAERVRQEAALEAEREKQVRSQQELAASAEAEKLRRREQEARELGQEDLDDGPMLVSGDETQDEPDSTSSMANHNNNICDQNNIQHLKQCERVDSLDSGEGRTESASTSQTSRTTTTNTATSPSSSRVNRASSIPTLIRRTNSSLSLTSGNTSDDDDLSSSRSSLLSGNEGDENNPSSKNRHDPMDLDGKVMRIAKSYYGKGAKRGVTRLSEGKYKIADRIVFVRLLKGHRVMVRIGGGWDTLENFLFRHKSDPSQVIDVDNLLPLETKMSFEKNHGQQTSTSKSVRKNHNLPFYKRSDSASSTNLSMSNRSIANSPTSSSIHSLLHQNTNLNPSSSVASSTPNSPIIRQHQTSLSSAAKQQQSPFFLINRGQNLKPLPHSVTTSAATNNGLLSGVSSIIHQQHYSRESSESSGMNVNNAQQQQQQSQSTLGSKIIAAMPESPLMSNGGSRIPTQMSEHKTRHLLSNGQNLLLPATLTTRPLSATPPTTVTASKFLLGGANRSTNSTAPRTLGSTQNLNRTTQRQNMVRNLGRSNDSLQQKASALSTQKRLGPAVTTTSATSRSSSIQNLNTKRRLVIEVNQRPKSNGSKLPTSTTKNTNANGTAR